MNTSDRIAKHCKKILDNRQLAIAYAIVFAILPFTSWLSVALVALITLRKGGRSGFDVLVPALVIHSAPLMILVPWSTALIHASIAYLPVYFAAFLLRRSEKWQIVFGAWFMTAAGICVYVQYFYPDFITLQYQHIHSLLVQYQELMNNSVDGLSVPVLAQLFFGLQILSVVISSSLSLFCARAIQARLFVPGGFKYEVLTFRSGKFGVLMLFTTSLGAYYQIPLAINLLPMVLCYLFASGFGLVFFVLSRKSQFRILLLMVLLILLRPTFVIFAYIIMGTLDSFINFRAYLPERVGETI
ncbi:MAG: hypothetical protein BGO90_05840 [Legionella sp. 40-6]|nr:hypothetical protein [Legionella sp.]OJY32968.1 MAG: hypothetical protein BGO90_05840 [Legionella sp. 40-6]